MKKFAILAVVAATVCATLGCGSGANLDDLNSVSGVVTLDGEPVADASITLYPTAEGARSAGCLSDEKGEFKFQTLQANDGVADGEYKVVVTKKVELNPYTEEEYKKLNESGASHKKLFPGRPEPSFEDALPKKYGNVETTDLTLTINGGAKGVKIEMTSN